MYMNQGYVYFSNFTLALLEYTKSGEQIKNNNNKHNKLKIIMLIII